MVDKEIFKGDIEIEIKKEILIWIDLVIENSKMIEIEKVLEYLQTHDQNTL